MEAGTKRERSPSEPPPPTPVPLPESPQSPTLQPTLAATGLAPGSAGDPFTPPVTPLTGGTGSEGSPAPSVPEGPPTAAQHVQIINSFQGWETDIDGYSDIGELAAYLLTTRDRPRSLDETTAIQRALWRLQVHGFITTMGLRHYEVTETPQVWTTQGSYYTRPNLLVLSVPYLASNWFQTGASDSREITDVDWEDLTWARLPSRYQQHKGDVFNIIAAFADEGGGPH